MEITEQVKQTKMIKKEIIKADKIGKIDIPKIAKFLHTTIYYIKKQYNILVDTNQIEKEVGETIDKMAKYDVIKPKQGKFPIGKDEVKLGKKSARKRIFKNIINSGVEGTILSLPYIDCVIETMLLAKKYFKFVGVEKEAYLFDQMKEHIRVNKLTKMIKPYYGKMADKIYGALANTYAHLILDYCGQLPSFIREIEHAIMYDIVKVNGTISMTFSVTIRNSIEGKELMDIADIPNNKETRSVSRIVIDNFFAGLCYANKNYEVIEKFYYTDSSPMVLVTIRRIK